MKERIVTILFIGVLCPLGTLRSVAITSKFGTVVEGPQLTVN
jgi:hypothetical protein